jgi:hypothetical protein
MKAHFLMAIPLLTALSATAGPYDQPYAIVESGAAAEARNEGRVTIRKIDGESTRDPRRSDPVEPGKRTITVGFQSSRGMFRPQSLDIELNLEPCTRYRIVASYESTSGPTWTPKVYPEPIAECRKKFRTESVSPATGK